MNTTQPTNNKAAIVILNWNGSKMMQQYLPNVIECSKDEAQVVIADNASTDDSLQMLNRDFPQLRTIVLDDNYGFAEGYNRALKQVDAEYYVLLNSDVEVTPHWLKPLLNYMDTHPECAVCQPKLRSIFHREEFEYAGASGGKLDILGYPFCRGRIFDIVEKDHGQYDTPDLLAWATGACMVIRKKDYWEAGALDKRFFAHNEEIDLCWRLRIMGRDIMLVPQSVVYHVGGGTLPKSNPMKTFLNFRNNLTMIYKNVEREERLSRPGAKTSRQTVTESSRCEKNQIAKSFIATVFYGNIMRKVIRPTLNWILDRPYRSISPQSLNRAILFK